MEKIEGIVPFNALHMVKYDLGRSVLKRYISGHDAYAKKSFWQVLENFVTVHEYAALITAGIFGYILICYCSFS